MDEYADRLIARGPTFESDESVTGSVHFVHLQGPGEARRFALDEPYYQAGVFRDVLLRRWENQLGRTMWEFPDPREELPRFLVLGLGGHNIRPDAPDSKLLACGPLFSDDGSKRLGAVALVQTADVGEALGILSGGDGTEPELHRWEVGGRPGSWPAG